MLEIEHHWLLRSRLRTDPAPFVRLVNSACHPCLGIHIPGSEPARRGRVWQEGLLLFLPYATEEARRRWEGPPLLRAEHRDPEGLLGARRLACWARQQSIRRNGGISVPFAERCLYRKDKRSSSLPLLCHRQPTRADRLFVACHLVSAIVPNRLNPPILHGRVVDGTASRLPPTQPQLSTGRRLIQRTLLTRFWDFTDATRGYPGDFTDESNN